MVSNIPVTSSLISKEIYALSGQKYILSQGKVKVAQSCPILCDPHGLYSPWNSPAQNTRTLEWVAIPFSRDLPKSGIEPRSPALQEDSLPAKPSGKPKNSGVGSLSLLQQIFPTQESNQGLLHCKWILNQLSY